MASILTKNFKYKSRNGFKTDVVLPAFFEFGGNASFPVLDGTLIKVAAENIRDDVSNHYSNSTTIIFEFSSAINFPAISSSTLACSMYFLHHGIAIVHIQNKHIFFFKLAVG
jgi:hypothetical protein